MRPIFRGGFGGALFRWAPIALDELRLILTVAGTDRSLYYERESLEILDEINELPNTLGFTCFGFTPANAQVVRLTVGATKEFEGTITSISEYHDKLNGRTAYRVSCTDYTRDFDALLVTKAYGSQSGTTTAQDIVTNFSSGFTQVNIAAALPTVTSIQFKMTKPSSALRQLCDAIGGDCYVDYDKDVHVFLTETDVVPLTVSASTTHWKAFKFRSMIERVANRIFVEGMGTTAASGCNVGETIVPVADVSMFSVSGGSAVIQNQILTYTGVVVGGGGALVGPGASPSAAPGLTLAAGTGLGVGAYQYAYTDVTAAGESLPSPLGTVTTGNTTAPSAAPTVGAATSSGSVDVGSHDYEVTFVTGSGETTPSAVSSAVAATNAQVTSPTVATSYSSSGMPDGGGWGTPGVSAWTIRYAYSTKSSPTDFTSMTDTGASAGGFTADGNFPTFTAAYSTDPSVLYIIFFYTPAGSGLPVNTPNSGAFTLANNSAGGTGSLTLFSAAGGLTAATSNTTPFTSKQTIPLSAIPIGAAAVTSRKLYRRFNGSGTFKLVTTIGNNTATTYSDTTANASLGAAAPSVNTATAQRVSVSGIAAGASSTTARKVYRTAVGASQLKLLTTIADNTTTTYADSTADGSLGANAPTSDTSALAQPSGQVLAGSTTLLLSGAGAFSSSGGWVRVNTQVLRYTGISTNTLTGIPASGNGSIGATINYNSTAVVAAALTGVPSSSTGSIATALVSGDEINLLVQRDDATSQSTYGIRHAYVQDRRLSQTGAEARGDAELTLRKDPYIEGSYVTTDAYVRSGRRATISMTSEWGIAGTYTISKVRVYWDAAHKMPLREVTFSSNAGASDLFRLIRRIREQQQQQTAA